MKTFLSILAAVTVFGIAVPANAAHHRRIVNYVNGIPVYAVYQIVGYTPLGFPIYQWVTQPVNPVYGRPFGPPGHWGHGHFGHDNGLHKGWYKH